MDKSIKLSKLAIKRTIVILVVLVILIRLDCIFDDLITRIVPSFDQSVLSTITSIQVTVGTLVFTIVAIVSGNISDTYLGISITDYYLNKKHKEYSQFKLIEYFLLLTIISVLVGYLFELRLVVLFCFLFTLIIVYLSAKSVYKVFQGKYKIQEEIEQYIECMLKQCGNYQLVLPIFVSLSKEWSEKLDNQNFSEYSKYSICFQKFISKLMEIGNAKALDEVDRICSSICNQFFVSEKKSINKRGLLVVSDVYAKINDKVNDDRLKLCTSKEGLSFFKNIEFDLSKSLEKFDYYEARDHILKINDLLNILVVAVMTSKPKNEESLFEVINSISNYLKGYFSLLSKQDYDLSSTVKDQLYSGMFEIGNKYGNSKNILNEGASFLFFIFCRDAIDHDLFMPILEKISGVSKDENELYDNFTTINNKEQATALLALECYIFGMILHNESKIMGYEKFIKDFLRSLINNLEFPGIVYNYASSSCLFR